MTELEEFKLRTERHVRRVQTISVVLTLATIALVAVSYWYGWAIYVAATFVACGFGFNLRGRLDGKWIGREVAEMRKLVGLNDDDG